MTEPASRSLALSTPAALALALLLTAPLAAESAPPRLAAGAQIVHLPAFNAKSAREVYAALGAATGVAINVAPDTRDQTVSAALDGLNLARALDVVSAASGCFWIALDERTALVASDTPQGRRAYEQLGLREFALEHAEVKDVLAALRAFSGSLRVSADEERRTIVVEAPYPHLARAARLVTLLDRAPSQLALDVTVLDVAAPALAAWLAAAPSNELVAGDLAALLIRLDAHRVAGSTLGLRGSRGSRLEVQATAMSPGLSVDVEARVEPATRAVTLRLALAAGDSWKLATSEDLADGSTLVLVDPSPIAPTAARARVVTLRPRVEAVGEVDPAAAEGEWSGTYDVPRPDLARAVPAGD